MGGDRPGDVADASAARFEQGFRAVKMNATEAIGWLDSPDSLKGNPSSGFARCARRVSTPGSTFTAVSTSRWRASSSRRSNRTASLFVEEPLTSEHPEAIAQLAAQTHVPLAFGERLYTRWDFKRLFELGAVDIVQPDLKPCRRHFRGPADRRDGRNL